MNTPTEAPDTSTESSEPKLADTVGEKAAQKVHEDKFKVSKNMSVRQICNIARLEISELLLEVQRLCYIADKILGHMYEVNNHMADFEAYIQTQKNENKPLHQWAKYKGYRAINRAISELDEATSQLAPVDLPLDDYKVYLRKATQFSLSVSKIAVFAMGVMGDKFDTCIDEIEESDLSAEGKANAKTLVTMELKNLVKHCTRATGRIYSALDILRESITTRQSDPALELSLVRDLLAERNEAQRRAAGKRGFWTLIGISLGIAVTIAAQLIAMHLYGPAGFDLVLKSYGPSNGMYAQVLDLVQRTQAVTNLTGEIYSVKLQDVNQRYDELAAVAEAHGLRIDNLVEGLGPTNEEGVYYSAMPKPDYTVPDTINHRIDTISDNTGREMQRLRGEMEQVRKNVNRMDLRLTKRLDKVDRKG